MSNLDERLAALGPYPQHLIDLLAMGHEIATLGGLYVEQNAWLLKALALAREWIVSPRHFPECENRSIAALFCHECEGKVLDALEVPK